MKHRHRALEEELVTERSSTFDENAVSLAPRRLLDFRRPTVAHEGGEHRVGVVLRNVALQFPLQQVRRCQGNFVRRQKLGRGQHILASA